MIIYIWSVTAENREENFTKSFIQVTRNFRRVMTLSGIPQIPISQKKHEYISNPFCASRSQALAC